MSEILYKVLDLTRPVSTLSFGKVFEGMDVPSPSNNLIVLSGEGFRALVKVLFCYGLHHGEVPKEQRHLFLRSILENEQNFFGVSLTFCGHLLNNLDATSNTELKELQRMEWNLDDLLSNEQLMDFVEMELIDPTVSFRKWEYGRYALDLISKDFFGTIDWEQQKNIFDSANVKTEDYLDGLEKDFDRSGSILDGHEKILLQLVARSKFWPQKISLPEHLLAGEIVQSNLIGLNLRKVELTSSLDHSLRNQRSNKKDKGGPKL